MKLNEYIYIYIERERERKKERDRETEREREFFLEGETFICLSTFNSGYVDKL